eukprot:scaffold28024_cov39-Prasinocladus_malaysianus.AAC.2
MFMNFELFFVSERRCHDLLSFSLALPSILLCTCNTKASVRIKRALIALRPALLLTTPMILRGGPVLPLLASLSTYDSCPPKVIRAPTVETDSRAAAHEPRLLGFSSPSPAPRKPPPAGGLSDAVDGSRRRTRTVDGSRPAARNGYITATKYFFANVEAA